MSLCLYFRLMQTSALGLELCAFDIKSDRAGSCFTRDAILEQTFLIDWSKWGLNLFVYSEMCVFACVWVRRTYHQIIPLYIQLPQPPALVAPGYIFYSAERVDRLSPSGALVLFLGRPLNDRCLAVSQRQPWRSPHWAWLNRCLFSHNTPFRLHLPASYSRPALKRTANFCDCKTSVY